MRPGSLISATAFVVGWLATVGPLAITPASAAPEPVSLALSGGRLLDGFGGPPLEDAVVLISGERIVAVGALREFAVPDGVPVIDTNGMTMLPGLWESHGHLFHVGEADPGAFQARFADSLPAIMQAVARVSVEAGITGYRDFCTRCASEAEGSRSPLLESQQDLRRRILDGELPGPRLYLSGPILRPGAPGQDPPGPFTVATPAEARTAVGKLAAMGVDNVFVGADLWELPLLSVIVEAAHRAGLGVDAESRHVRATEVLLEAGVDRIHVLFTAEALAANADDELRALVRGARPAGTGPSGNILRGPWFLSTLPMRQAYAYAREFPEVLDHPRFRDMFTPEVYADLRENWRAMSSIPWGIGATERAPVAQRKLARFVEAGGREQLVAATDVGAPLNFHSPIPLQLRNLVAAGLTPMEAIQSATLRAAQMQGVDDDVGTVTPGKFADIIVVDGDPLQDITVLQHRVVRVVMNGEVVR